LRGGFLLLAHALVEDREGLVEAAIDLRAAVIGRDRPGAATVVAARAASGVTARAAAGRRRRTARLASGPALRLAGSRA
jgi:hypothetical protein